MRNAVGLAIHDAVRRLLQAEGNAARPSAVRSAAVETLASIQDWEGCLIALSDPVPHIRMRAADHLVDFDPAYVRVAELGDPALESRFLRKLQELKIREHKGPVGAHYHLPSVWLGRLEALFASKDETIRRQVIDLFSERREKIPQELGTPFACKALQDPSTEIREIAADALGGFGAWDDLLAAWDDVVRVRPDLAIEAAALGDRVGRIESLRSHPDSEVREAAEECLFDRAEPKEIPSFLSSPFPAIRMSALDRLFEARDLPGFAPALGDEKMDIAETAYERFARISGEVNEKLHALIPEDAAFASLDVAQRRAIAEALIPWLRSRGNSIWLGRALERLKELHKESARYEDLRDSGRFSVSVLDNILGGVRHIQEDATRLLCAALPDPQAIEILVSSDDIRADIAAEAFGRLRLAEPLKRLAARLQADPEAERLGGEILEALARAGESRFVRDYIASQPDPWQPDFLHLSAAIKASGDAGPEGPLPFLELLSRFPEKAKEAQDLVTAFRTAGSAEGVRRVLAELPSPPVYVAFDALIALGDLEPVFQQALEGEFWYEAASALRNATGGWFGYFGPDWVEAVPPPKYGILGFAMSGRVHVLDPQACREAVDAWRKALEKRASEKRSETP
ncbi:MAG: hypothetical protein JXP34_16255 [Planctomycetes bacterium]|nr:hypothetical protein [Planctomycetota bacterium]